MTHNKFVLVSGSEIREAESMLNEIVSSKISKTDFEMYQQHFRNEMSIENLFSDIDSESDQRHSVNEAIFSENNNKILNIIKWDASSCGSSTLYYPMRNSNEMTIGKMDPTLINSSNHFHEHLFSFYIISSIPISGKLILIW